MNKTIQSTCIYCGCGCLINYEVNENKIIKVSGVRNDDVSEGMPCIKGLTIHEVYDKNRITKPMIKGKTVTINQALNYVYNHTKSLAPNEVFFNTSGKITNEDDFVLEKFARICYKTANVDSCCGRLCHDATVMAMKNVFGNPNLTLMSNVNKIDTLFIIGSEPDKNYPVFYNKLLRNNKIRIIRVNSFVKGCIEQEHVITIKPGSETCLLNGLINELIKKGVKSNLPNFDLLKEVTKTYNPAFVIKTCGLTMKNYKSLIKEIIKSKKLGVFHGMALTQHVNSIENVHSLLNLVLLKKGLILSLRGEINVQGVGDVSVLSPGSLSTKQSIKWNNVSSTKGLNIIEALMLSPVKAAFITEFDPFKSLPDLKQVKSKLKKTFITYFGSHHNDTSRIADVVIPIASLLESEGTITNGERRLRKVNKVINGPMQLWSLLKIFSKKFKKSNYFNYNTPLDIFKEIKRTITAYNDINEVNLWSGSDEWSDKTIKFKRFMPEQFDGLDASTNNKYPFILTTYRSKFSFLNNEVTKSSPTLSRLREPAGFYLNKEDMNKLKLINGVKIKVSSTVGSLTGKAYSSDRVPKGIIGSFMHYSSLPINKLFPLRFDEESFTPNYKAVAVNVTKT